MLTIRFLFCLLVVGTLGIRVPANAAEKIDSLIIAHRGLLKHAPENTFANFRACLELRIGFEFDVERTRDGHLVCIHDSTVDRTTNGTGPVAELTLAELKQLDAGSWFDARFAGEKVPTIDEVLQLLAGYSMHNILVAVDLKADGTGQEVVRLAEKHHVLHRLLFIGKTISDPAVRDAIRQASSSAHTAAVANNVDEFKSALSSPDSDWVYLRYIPTAAQITTVHQAGKKAFIAGSSVSGHVPVNWDRATTAGLDGILTDYPLELLRMLRQKSSLERQ